jgi:hypothetical protein
MTPRPAPPACSAPPQVRRSRAVQRKGRQAAGVPVVALVGYTNAGKSTLVNALTRSEIYARDQLFATLDPTARRLELPGGQVRRAPGPCAPARAGHLPGSPQAGAPAGADARRRRRRRCACCATRSASSATCL